MKKTAFVLILLSLFAGLLCSPVFASEVTPISWYHYEPDPDMPKPLYVGYTMDCGNYSIRLLQQPVLGKYSYHLIADNELEYLVVRAAITNKSENTLAWLNADSFKVLETYKGRMYSTYSLDITASALTSEGFHQQAFFEKIEPGETLYTSLVFSVYPDVDGWVMRFAPRAYYEEYPPETVTFQLPQVFRYSEDK